jgi:hydrogenase expression/formation protein HypC
MEVLTIDGQSAEVQVGGTRQTVRLDLISEFPEVGDFVIVHAGFALTRWTGRKPSHPETFRGRAER